MPSAMYSHITPPVVLNPGTSSVCLHIVFEDAGADINDPGLSHEVYRSGQDPDTGSWLTVFPPGDGTSEVERAHLGCVGLIRSIALRRGYEIEPGDVTYGGA